MQKNDLDLYKGFQIGHCPRLITLTGIRLKNVGGERYLTDYLQPSVCLVKDTYKYSWWGLKERIRILTVFHPGQQQVIALSNFHFTLFEPSSMSPQEKDLFCMLYPQINRAWMDKKGGGYA